MYSCIHNLKIVCLEIVKTDKILDVGGIDGGIEFCKWCRENKNMHFNKAIQL